MSAEVAQYRHLLLPIADRGLFDPPQCAMRYSFEEATHERRAPLARHGLDDRDSLAGSYPKNTEAHRKGRKSDRMNRMDKMV